MKKLLLPLLFASLYLPAQQPWTVKQEWVRAHEEFLASDVLAGRGSATRDEQITATYVASQFMGYGLKPAPGITGYLQSAEIKAPVLDGKSTLTIGDTVLHEGTDFQLLTSSGTNTGGPLARQGPAQPARGSVLLIPTPGMQAMNAARRAGASIVVGVEDDSTRQMQVMMGGKTRTPMSLKEVSGGIGGRRGTTLTVSPATMQKLLAEKTAKPPVSKFRNFQPHPA